MSENVFMALTMLPMFISARAAVEIGQDFSGALFISLAACASILYHLFEFKKHQMRGVFYWFPRKWKGKQRSAAAPRTK